MIVRCNETRFIHGVCKVYARVCNAYAKFTSGLFKVLHNDVISCKYILAYVLHNLHSIQFHQEFHIDRKLCLHCIYIYIFFELSDFSIVCTLILLEKQRLNVNFLFCFVLKNP